MRRDGAMRSGRGVVIARRANAAGGSWAGSSRAKAQPRSRPGRSPFAQSTTTGPRGEMMTFVGVEVVVREARDGEPPVEAGEQAGGGAKRPRPAGGTSMRSPCPGAGGGRADLGDHLSVRHMADVLRAGYECVAERCATVGHLTTGTCSRHQPPLQEHLEVIGDVAG